MTDLYAKCEIVYNQVGQSGVFDYINRHHPSTPWSYCEPCESLSPIDDEACLVCGTYINQICDECGQVHDNDYIEENN